MSRCFPACACQERGCSSQWKQMKMQKIRRNIWGRMNLLILYHDKDSKMFPWSCLVRRCGTTRARYWTGTQFSQFCRLHDNPPFPICELDPTFRPCFAFSRLVFNRFIRFNCKNFCPCKCYQITVVPGNLPSWSKHGKVGFLFLKLDGGGGFYDITVLLCLLVTFGGLSLIPALCLSGSGMLKS